MGVVKGDSSVDGVPGVLGESNLFNGVLGVTKSNGHAGVAGVSDEGVGNGIYGRSKNAQRKALRPLADGQGLIPIPIALQ